MRRTVLVTFVLAGSQAVAVADDTEHDRPLSVRARLDGDVARFVVRYRIESRDGVAKGQGPFALPEHGLVTAAKVFEGSRSRTLALVPAAQASGSFDALFDSGPSRTPTHAVMIDADGDRDRFRVSTAVPPGKRLIVETEIAAPTCYGRDARFVAVPSEWLPLVSASQRLPAEATPCGEHAETGDGWIAFPSRKLSERRASADRVATRAARAKLGSTEIAKLEVNLAAKLSEVPADLVTAIVVDSSRSMTPEALEEQRTAIAAYLRAVPHSRVQIIAYARRARPLLPAWMDATGAATRVDRELRALRLENGSSVEAGLREAARWLASATGTRRIVLFTDEHLSARTEFTRAADNAVPAGTLVHVVALGGDDFERDDQAKLARLAVQTHGLSVRGGGKPEDRELDATLLARPISLDHVVVRTPGFTAFDTQHSDCRHDTRDDPQSLAEGTACTWWGEGAGATPFTVEGLLWNERVVRVLHPDPTRGLDAIREASVLGFLDEELQELADHAARAVNEVWSLYAAWGGDGGYETGLGIGLGSYYTCSARCGGVFGSGTIGKLAETRPDLAAEFRRIVQAACAPREPLALEVETTVDEIVGVTVDAPTAALRTCATEALWSAALVAPNAPAHAITAVKL